MGLMRVIRHNLAKWAPARMGWEGRAILVMVFLLAGCATTGQREEPPPPLANAHVDAVWLTPDTVHVVLKEGERLIHAEAGRRLPPPRKREEEDRAVGGGFGRTLTLRPVKSPEAASHAPPFVTARLAGPEALKDYLRVALEPFAPSGPGEAVRLTLGDYTVHMVRRGGPESEVLFLDSLPVGYRVVSHYAGPELRDDLLSAYDAWSASEERAGVPTAFQLGSLTATNVPFLVLDPLERDGLTLRFTRRSPWNLERDAMSQLGLGWVLVKSHTISVISRPVSSTRRLAALVRDSVSGLLSRSYLSLGKFPALDKKPIPEIDPARGNMDLAAFEAFLDGYAAEPATTARLRFLIGGEAYFTALNAAIDAARERVDLQTYIFDNDDIALEMANRLRDHPGQVRVRILCDGLGTTLAARVDPEVVLTEASARPTSITGYLRQAPNIRLRVRPNTWGAGDHTKVTIIDGKTAFLGGMNIGQEYRYQWHDLMVEIEGPLVNVLQTYFDRAWTDSGLLGDLGVLLGGAASENPAHSPAEAEVRVLRTTPWRQEIYRTQVEAARRSKNRIYVENAYLADDLIVYELCSARKRGVDVRVIMPAAGNHEIMNRNNVLVANALLKHGVRVFLYPKMSHVKAALFDGWACFGSANLDRLSLQTNLEMNLATAHPETVARLARDLFEKDMAASIELQKPLKADSFDWVFETLGDSL